MVRANCGRSIQRFLIMVSIGRLGVGERAVDTDDSVNLSISDGKRRIEGMVNRIYRETYRRWVAIAQSISRGLKTANAYRTQPRYTYTSCWQ
jgi:hypothetical protein